MACRWKMAAAKEIRLVLLRPREDSNAAIINTILRLIIAAPPHKTVTSLSWTICDIAREEEAHVSINF